MPFYLGKEIWHAILQSLVRFRRFCTGYGYYFYNDDEFVEGELHHRKMQAGAAVLAQKKDKKVVAKGHQNSSLRNKGKVQPADEDGFVDDHADDDEGEKFFKN